MKWQEIKEFNNSLRYSFGRLEDFKGFDYDITGNREIYVNGMDLLGILTDNNVSWTIFDPEQNKTPFQIECKYN
jgi:hypothetical protein